MTTTSPPCEQVEAGQIAHNAIKLGRQLTSTMIDGKRLDKEIEEFIRDHGGEPALKGYQPRFSDTPYKWTTCLCRDNEVVHGTPIRLLGPTHIITIDLVVRYRGWCADTARTFTISDDPKKKQFVELSTMIFDAGLNAIGPEQPMNLFGLMVEESAKLKDYGIVKEFCGHGIGTAVHMEPQVLNYSTPTEEVFEVGKAYAVEPVLAIKNEYKLNHSKSDGWVVTADCLTSHNEDTVFISKDGVINLTGG